MNNMRNNNRNNNNWSSNENSVEENSENTTANNNINNNMNNGTDNTAGNSWQNDPSLKNMDLKKLAFLSELVSQSGSQSMDSLLPFLVSANKNANSMGLQFNDSETNLILNVLKSRMSPEEQSRIEMIRKMADMLGKRSL